MGGGKGVYVYVVMYMVTYRRMRLCDCRNFGVYSYSFSNLSVTILLHPPHSSLLSVFGCTQTMSCRTEEAFETLEDDEEFRNYRRKIREHESLCLYPPTFDRIPASISLSSPSRAYPCSACKEFAFASDQTVWLCGPY